MYVECNYQCHLIGNGNDGATNSVHDAFAVNPRHEAI